MPTKNTTRKTTAAKKATPAKSARSKAAKPVEEAVESVASASSSDQFASFLNDLRSLVETHLNNLGQEVPPFDPDNKPAPAEAVAEEDAEKEEQTREEREEELQGFTVRQLQQALIATDEFDEKEIKGEKDKDTLIENLLDFEFGEEGDDEEEDEEDESDEDEEDAETDEEDEEDSDSEEYSKSDLLKLSLAELRKLATSDEFGIDASEVKGKDKDTIADLILEAQGAEGDDEDEDDEEGDGEDEEYWTEEELKELSLADLKGVADESGVTYNAAQGRSKPQLIKLILEA